jgi:hypothetical protein
MPTPTQSTPLTFGVNPYDLKPQDTGRYHVIDDKGFIRAKTKYGHTAYDHAGNLSDRESDVKFSAVDTRDGSLYGAYLNGESVA